ncbi:hypothetical protein B0T17DRAFT_589996 [Bombardia bombarda]|uniref:Uncharacterized protein n=1 Tax=Bombardia bombarda TaxID=252184 RepID=A0AA40C9V1_9PEZI|nr:hypothetical protein B0T17DRAFT_589996 [Bombardia bombarda]
MQIRLDVSASRAVQVSASTTAPFPLQHHLKRARLTRENLALFNKMAKKKGNSKTLTSVPLESTLKSSSTAMTTSTTMSGFATQAQKNGILQPRCSKPPSEYKRYVNKVEGARNEATMVYEVGKKLLKEYDDTGYHRVFNQAFTAFPKDVGLNNALSAPQPDFVEGLELQEYRPFPVDEHVSGAAVYKDDPFSLVLPHVAGEWKARGKDMEEAKLQSSYDGAALVYARNQALSYIGEPDPPGHAEVTTFTTDGTNLNFYAHYAAQTEDGTLEYHQYQYASANVKDSHAGHKDGRRGLRNQQDHAREQSYSLRDQLKGHWKQHGSLHPIVQRALQPTHDSTLDKTDAVQDESGYEVVEQPCQPTPAASNSASSSKSVPPVNDYAGQKRKGLAIPQVLP